MLCFVFCFSRLLVSWNTSFSLSLILPNSQTATSSLLHLSLTDTEEPSSDQKAFLPVPVAHDVTTFNRQKEQLQLELTLEHYDSRREST